MARYELTAVNEQVAGRSLLPLGLGTIGTMIAAPIYLLLIDVPLIRSTGWPMFLLAAVGAVVGAAYARLDDRQWVRIAGVVNVGALVFAAIWFFWLASLPSPDAKASLLTVAPDFQLNDQNGRPVSLSATLRGGPVLLVFYRGSWCPFCVSELRGLTGISDELRQSRVRVLAVSADIPQKSQQAVERLGLKFPLLCDAERNVIRDYGVVDRGGGPGGEDIAIPAHFLIDRDGRILWRRIAGRVQDRPDPRELLRLVLDATTNRMAAR